jgi:hypothetical protein
VLADARAAAWLALASLAVVLADARPAALLAPVSLAVVLADARPAAFLAFDSSSVVLADARPAAFLAPASSSVVLADARAAALLALASLVVMLADAPAAALLALAFLAVVRALCYSPLVLHSASSCPFTTHFLPTLLLPCFAVCFGHGTLSLLHSLPFPFAFKATQIVHGLFLPLVPELLASRPTSLTARPLC